VQVVDQTTQVLVLLACSRREPISFLRYSNEHVTCVLMTEVSKKSFGGSWSDDKLDTLRAYLSAYTTALKKTPFKLAYIDAFAGAGTRDLPADSEDGLFDDSMLEETINYGK
jgi:hypothetical protein